MISTDVIIEKVRGVKRLDDLVALNHYVDYLLFRESSSQTELGQAIINGLENILEDKTYSINSSSDVLRIADEI